MPGGVKADPGVAQPPPTGTLLLRDISTLATQNDDLGEIKDAAVFVRANVIEWVGPQADLPADKQTADQVISLKGCVAIPGRHRIRPCDLLLQLPPDTGTHLRPPSLVTTSTRVLAERGIQTIEATDEDRP
jgi:hypothetical protein